MKRVFAMLFCLLLVSCAGMPPREATPGLATTACEGDINLSGRFSMHLSRDGNEEALHGSFQWNQVNDHTGIVLLSPLGQTIATIDVTPDAATLTQAGRAPRMALDADALAAAELGWPLPVLGLHGWLRGCTVDANGAPYIASRPDDSVTTRDGWRIRYVSWQENTEGDTKARRYPRRIDLERIGSPAGDISLRLVIDSWQNS